jgi:hypothetical protein
MSWYSFMELSILWKPTICFSCLCRTILAICLDVFEQEWFGLDVSNGFSSMGSTYATTVSSMKCVAFIHDMCTMAGHGMVGSSSLCECSVVLIRWRNSMLDRYYSSLSKNSYCLTKCITRILGNILIFDLSKTSAVVDGRGKKGAHTKTTLLKVKI